MGKAAMRRTRETTSLDYINVFMVYNESYRQPINKALSMYHSSQFAHALAALVALFGAVSVTVRAETIDCTEITSLPAVISNQGVYCLTGNLTTSTGSGAAIDIMVSNVTLDLNSWKVGGQAAGLGTAAVGIFSDANNVTVKNGIVRGFLQGIILNGRGAVVEDILADQNTSIGIVVAGQGAVVRRNKVVDTGGPSSISIGISVGGTGSLIENNLVSDLTATGATALERGIVVSEGGDFSTLRENVISEVAFPGGAIASEGIRVGDASLVGVIGNSVTRFGVGVNYSGGASGTYASNITSGCTTPFSGGTAGPDNHP
jgi:hypothetical protein